MILINITCVYTNHYPFHRINTLMLNYSILLKKISKSIGNEITEDMDLLKVIGKVTTNNDVKTIINSVNDNHIKNKLWLTPSLIEFSNINAFEPILLSIENNSKLGLNFNAAKPIDPQPAPISQMTPFLGSSRSARI